MKNGKICTPNDKICVSQKKTIIAVFAIIALLAVGFSYFAIVEKNSPGYNTNPLKLALMSLDKFTIGLTLIVGLGILGISVKAFQKTQSTKFLLITVAFALFSLEWAMKLIDRYFIPGQLIYGPVENLIELAIIVFLALGIFLKK